MFSNSDLGFWLGRVKRFVPLSIDAAAKCAAAVAVKYNDFIYPADANAIAPVNGDELAVGDVIEITITPTANYECSLYVNGDKKTPVSNKVTVKITSDIGSLVIKTTAIPLVSSIAVTTPPATVTYIAGEALDLTGMKVTATYTDSSTKEVTGYTTSPANGAALTTEDTEVTITYTERATTKTTTQAITVTEEEEES